MDRNEPKKPGKNNKKPGAGSVKRENTAKAEATAAEAGKQAGPVAPGAKAKTQKKHEPARPQSATKEIVAQHPSTSPQTKMEVHHHPQLEHKKKPFKEYLLEGLMIFIAVMMGFVSENIRQDITDNQHVRQLTLQLAKDLRADTATLNNIYTGEMKILHKNDTLFSLLQQPLAKADLKRIQKLVGDSHGLWPFHLSSAGAIAAIKNELHLKQFSESDIIDYIAAYESDIDLLHTVQDISLQYQRNYLEPFLTEHFTPANMVAAFDQHAMPNAQMRDLTQEDLTQLDVNMVLVRINTNEQVEDIQKVKTKAVNLLRYVTKQYGLEDK